MNRHDDDPTASTEVAADPGTSPDLTAPTRESPLPDTVVALLRHPETWQSPDPTLEQDVLDALHREQRQPGSEGHGPERRSSTT